MNSQMINLISLILNGAILPIGWVVWRILSSMRENDLRHLTEQTKTIADNHAIVMNTLERLTEKVDRHLEYHLEKKL